MRASQSERLGRKRELEISQRRLRANQIETMIAELEWMCIDLGHQIEAEEMRAQIHDPKHFAYPTYATAARGRHTKLQGTMEVLRAELDRLMFETNEAANRQYAA
jgi:flagellar protein FliJ